MAESASAGLGLGAGGRQQERWARFLTRVTNAFGLVFLLIIAIYVVGSLVPYRGWGGVALVTLTGMCATVALASAGASTRRVRGVAWLSAGSLALAAIAAASGGSAAAAGIAWLLQSVLLAIAALRMLGAVLGEEEVGFRTIIGAISVYVIVGLLFSFVYAGIDRLQAGDFFGTAAQTGDYLFFSITTLTTTGYGNLVPAAQPGRMLAGLEMLIGQIFLVTLIAGLVSLWRPGSRFRRSQQT